MTQFSLDAVGLLALAIQVVLPLLVGLVTRATTHPGAQALLLLVLTAVTQLLTLWYQDAQNHVAFDWKFTVFNVVVGFIISVGSHFGLWRPTTATAKVLAFPGRAGDPGPAHSGRRAA
jgi:hypothetical protein